MHCSIRYNHRDGRVLLHHAVLNNRKALSRDQNINFLRNFGSPWTGPCYRAARPTQHMLRTQPNPPPQNMTQGVQQAGIHPKHKSTWKYSHTNTLTPTRTLLQPAQSDKPHSLLDWTRKNDGSKKAQKCGNTGSPCLDKPLLGQTGEGYSSYVEAVYVPATSLLK